jgi:uncharacterized protein with beta-barrel porin domain
MTHLNKRRTSGVLTMLFAGTAISLVAVGPTQAACSANTPGAGASVICSPLLTDTDGVRGGASDVTVVNQAGSVIEADGAGPLGISPVIDLGDRANVTNAGDIIASGKAPVLTTAAISVGNGSTVNVLQSGSVSGALTGITITSGTVTNSGSIFGTITGVAAFGDLTLNNQGGTITGLIEGVTVLGGAANVTNSGTITGNIGQAMLFGGDDDRLELQQGSVINGDVQASGGTDTLVFGGAGAFNFDISEVDGDNANNGEQYLNFETFIKEDASTVTLIGDNAEIGAFSVVGGQLNVGGTMSANFAVGPGGTLGGTGTIGAFVADGTIAPGVGGASTLMVTGAGTFNAGSQFDADITAGGLSDRLDLTGPANLNGNGTVNPILSGGQLSDFQSSVMPYLLVTSASGVNGQFAGIIDNYAFFDFMLTYDPNNVYLSLQRLAFDSVAQTFNQRQVAGAIDVFDQTPGSEAKAIYEAFLGLSTPEALAAFDAIQGEVHANSLAGALQSSGFFNSILMGNAFGGAGGTFTAALGGQQVPDAAGVESSSNYGADLNTLTPLSNAQHQAWIGGFGGIADVDGDGNAAGYDARTVGLAIGVETDLSQLIGVSARAGFGLGYSVGGLDLNTRTQDGDIETWMVGVYGAAGAGRVEEGWSARASATFAWHEMEFARNIRLGAITQTATSDYSANSFSGDLEVRYNIARDFNWSHLQGSGVVAPFARLQAGLATADSFAETGAGALNLSGAARDWQTGSVALGVALSGDFELRSGEIWRPNLSIAYERAVGDEHASADLSLAGSPTPFSVRGPEESRNRLRFGAVSTYELGKGPNGGGASITIASDSVLSEDRTEWSGKASFKLEF